MKYLSKTKPQVEALELITDLSIRATLRMAIEDGKRLKVVNDPTTYARPSRRCRSVRLAPPRSHQQSYFER